MSTFSENQTKHFYVVAPTVENTAHYIVQDLEDSNLFRIVLEQTSGAGTVTTDIINRKLINKIKINEVKPTYFHKWTVKPMAANDIPAIGEKKKFSLYFYLENMYGFGLMDKWDAVASYTVTGSGVSADDIASIMSALKTDLDNKLNPTYADTPLKNDFIVTILDSTMNPKDGEIAFGVKPTVASTTWGNSDVESLSKAAGATSGSYVYTLVKHENNNKVTYTFTSNANVDVNNNAIIVFENPNSPTFKQLKDIDFRMHDNPYVYDVTLSTYVDTATGGKVWDGDQKRRIFAEENTNISPYVTSAQKVQAMELYFLRNRADMYDLTKSFNTSILNPVTELVNTTYYTLDIDYAFSDTQGYTYHSDKQLSIASSSRTTLDSLKEDVLEDSNETAYAAAETYTYSSSDDD